MLTARGDGSSKVRLFTAAALGALAVALVGCGDSAHADPVDAFIGSWIYAQATGQAACPMTDPIDQTPTGNKTFGRGVSNALVDLTPLLNPPVVCDFGFDIDATGTIATAPTGQGCALRGGDVFTLRSWKFSLLSATMAEEIAAGDISFTISQATTTCAYTLMANLTRVSKD
jgi:hypothetical protein